MIGNYLKRVKIGSKSFLLIINTLAESGKNSSQIIWNCRGKAVTSGYKRKLLKEMVKMGKNHNILIINTLENSLLIINTLAVYPLKKLLNNLEMWDTFRIFTI